jgi:hypothetical protein
MSTDCFSKAALQNLHIDRFIFHAIHDGSSEPLLLEEILVGDHEPFFMELVQECAKGNRYLFNEGSATRQQLAEIVEDPSLFQEKSRQLAQHFHECATGSVSPGIFFFMRLYSDSMNYFAMIKYDNQPVLRYSIADNRTVTIDELTNTITQNRSALQKSALIYLGDEEQELMVRDRQAAGGEIAAFFRSFLDVYRKQGQEQITRALHRAVVETVSKHAAELPAEFVRETSDRFAEVVGRGPRDRDGFCNDFFGDAAGNVRDTFEQQMHRRGIDDECPFDLDEQTAGKSRKRRYSTRGGITLQIPPDTQDGFEIMDCEDGTVQITIRTVKLWES